MGFFTLSRQITKSAALIKNSPNIFMQNGMRISIFSNATTPTSLLRSKSEVVAKRMMSGNHAQKWKMEKILTIALLPIIPATFSNPGTEILDNLFAILVTTHAHFGLEAVARDYMRPIVVGPALSKIAVGVVYTLTATTLGSLLYFNHHNVGIGAAGKQIWSIGKAKQEI